MTWICKEEKKLDELRFFRIFERICDSPNAAPDSPGHRFYILKSKDWCNVIPITENGEIVLVKQFRAGTLDASLEFPGGVVDATDADPKITALRELAEETGYTPLPGARCIELGKTHPNPAILTNTMYSFAVGPVRLTQKQNLDAMEDIEIVTVPIDQLAGLIADGKISHSLMLTTALLLLIKNEEFKNNFSSELKKLAQP